MIKDKKILNKDNLNTLSENKQNIELKEEEKAEENKEENEINIQITDNKNNEINVEVNNKEENKEINSEVNSEANNEIINNEKNNIQIEDIENIEDKEDKKENNLKINEAIINGKKISFPTTKEAFNGTNLEWDSKYAKRDLATGYTTSGGRIGTYPGGVVVSVINHSGETKHIEDCIISSATFYNGKERSNDKAEFIGGLNYNSKVDDIKKVMEEEGYKNPKESIHDKSIYLRYYLDDNNKNYTDYIEFNLYDGVINYILVSTRGY